MIILDPLKELFSHWIFVPFCERCDVDNLAGICIVFATTEEENFYVEQLGQYSILVNDSLTHDLFEFGQLSDQFIFFPAAIVLLNKLSDRNTHCNQKLGCPINPHFSLCHKHLLLSELFEVVCELVRRRYAFSNIKFTLAGRIV